MENVSSINQIISQISQQVSVSGKTLTREDYINNFEFFNEVSKILNEDPLYTHELNIKDGEFSYILTPKSEDAKRLEPIVCSMTLRPEDGINITLEQLLDESGRTGRPIIIDSNLINSISIHKGKKPLIANDLKFHRIELRPTPFELPVCIFTPGSSIAYNMILRVEEKSSTSLALSNYHSDDPIKFRFVFSRVSHTGEFNINYDLGKMDVTQAYHFNEFRREINDSGILGFREFNNRNIIYIAYISDSDSKNPIHDQFDLIRKLSFIQEIAGVRILFPLEITAVDVISIEEAFSFYKNRKVLMNLKRQSIGLDKIYAEHLVKLADEDGILPEFKIIINDYVLDVCGTELHLGTVEVQHPGMKTKKSITELKKELADYSEDVFNIELVQIEDSPVILRPKLP